MDQPTGIELATYLEVWPALEPYIKRLRASQAAAVEADLHLRAQSPEVSDGELNLLAQLEWQHGELDAADGDAARAVARQPNQSLNAFQHAMANFAHLRRAKGVLEQWKWQQKTRDAYQRTFALDPRNVSARYYLAYSYMNTPWIGGGDTKKALTLCDEGIALDYVGFYALRADAHRLRGEMDQADADYDAAIHLRVVKLSAFLDAAQEELKRKHWDRAKRYLDWALHCRPDSSKAQEGMGDYLVTIHETDKAKAFYQAAVQRDSSDDSARAKLAELSGVR